MGQLCGEKRRQSSIRPKISGFTPRRRIYECLSLALGNFSG